MRRINLLVNVITKFDITNEENLRKEVMMEVIRRVVMIVVVHSFLSLIIVMLFQFHDY